MCGAWGYLVDTRDDVILFADECPLHAVLISCLVLALMLAHIWGRWIIRLQHEAIPNLTNRFNSTRPRSDLYNASTCCTNAEVPYNKRKYGTNPGDTTQQVLNPESAKSWSTKSLDTATQLMSVGLGISQPWTCQGLEEVPKSTITSNSSVSEQSQSSQDSVISSPEERYIMPRGTFHGWTVVSPPRPRSNHVTFYASSSPSQRGECTVQKASGLMFGHIEAEISKTCH
jgi:hypothetical protein